MAVYPRYRVARIDSISQKVPTIGSEATGENLYVVSPARTKTASCETARPRYRRIARPIKIQRLTPIAKAALGSAGAY